MIRNGWRFWWSTSRRLFFRIFAEVCSTRISWSLRFVLRVRFWGTMGRLIMGSGTCFWEGWWLMEISSWFRTRRRTWFRIRLGSTCWIWRFSIRIWMGCLRRSIRMWRCGRRGWRVMSRRSCPCPIHLIRSWRRFRNCCCSKAWGRRRLGLRWGSLWRRLLEGFSVRHCPWLWTKCTMTLISEHQWSLF